jgi:formylglycine-generating enzyme required for sulfatase activity
LQNHLERLVNDVHAHLHLEKEPKDHTLQRVKHPNSAKEKTKKPPDMPEDVKKVISKAPKVDKNKNGYWESNYQDGIVMVYIPPGEFMMGQTVEEKEWLIDQIGEKDYNSYYANETPLHKVYLAGYWIGKYEVTFAQYDRYCKETKIEKPSDVGWGRENRPVINVSWIDAAAYCEWLSQKTGLKFKLPTEAQWEKAARGNDQRKYPWGPREPDKNLANFERIVGKTTPVGSYPAGASLYGLLDMAGNVWEWCSDWYETDYYKNSPPKNPTGSNSGSDRVIRGGGWYDMARDLRCASRGSDGPSYRVDSLGFRLRQDNR